MNSKKKKNLTVVVRCSSLRPFFASIHVTLTAHLSDFHPKKQSFWILEITSYIK